MRFAAALLAVLVALFAGMWLGGHSNVLPDALQDLVTDDEVATVSDAIARVEDDYYRRIGGAKLSDDAIRGAVSGLDDPFSKYLDRRDYERFRDDTHARFSGIGVTVNQVEGGLRIIQVYAKSPARKSGLRRGDVIVEVAGERLAGKAQDVATGRIRGPEGTSVELVVRRDGKELTKKVERAQIEIPVVASRQRTVDGRRYAHVRLTSFTSGSHAEVYKAVRKAVDGKVDGIVFDLRANGGGLVTEARLVASAFLEDGEIVTTRGRTVPEQVYRATGDPVAPKTPLVVLVDRDTASASEIVAGALQDRDRAKLVGTRTFGKGVFQSVIELDNGGALDITVGQYFLPSGRNLGGKGTARGKGLEPDVEARDDRKTPRRDEALERAFATLAGS